MAISKEVLDEPMKDYEGPDDITGPDGLIKRLTKALVERAIQAEMTEHHGYESGDKAKRSLIAKKREIEEDASIRPEALGNRGAS